jgi:hypothetical protein
MQLLKDVSIELDSVVRVGPSTLLPHMMRKICCVGEEYNAPFDPGQAAGSLELELEPEDEDEGGCAIGVAICVAARADVDAGAEAVVLAAVVVCAAEVFVTIPVAEEVPDVVVAVAVAATVELLDAVIVIRLEVEDGKLDEVDDVGAAGAGSFSFLSPNISPNPIPNASTRIIKTANTSRR